MNSTFGRSWSPNNAMKRTPAPVTSFACAKESPDDSRLLSVYVLSGKRKVTVGERTWDMEPGDFVFMPKGIANMSVNDIEVTLTRR